MKNNFKLVASFLTGVIVTVVSTYIWMTSVIKEAERTKKRKKIMMRVRGL